MEKDKPIISLETIEFLARHPWCFIYPFVIIACFTFSYIISLPNTYKCESIVSFGNVYVEDAPQRFAQRKGNLIAKIYFGNSIKQIIGIVWPDLSEETNPLGYAMLINTLRNPAGGISIQFDQRDPNLAHISFKSRSPDISYKVVQATINVIKLENARHLEGSVELSVTFLTRQLHFYKDKITTINAEMLRTSTRLKEMAEGLNVEQRELVHRITAEAIMEQQSNARAVSGEARNTDILAELEMKLVEAKRNKKMMELRQKEKDFAPMISESRDKKEDIFQRVIEEKKVAIFDLKSRGALPEHPEVKRLEKAVNDLEAFREKEASSIEARKFSKDEKKFAERKLKEDLAELNFTIETLEEQKAVLEKYRRAVEREPSSEEALVGPVAVEATKLKDLRDEKNIMVRSYGDLRNQLENTDLKSRYDKSQTGFRIDVIEPPMMPVTPLPSNKTNQLFFGLIMAIGAGSALSYFVDSLDKSIRSAAELRNKFQIPVIASIDRIYTTADIKSKRIQRSMIIISMGAFAVFVMLAVMTAMGMRV